MGDKNVKKQAKKHPSNEKVLASKAANTAATKAAETLAAAKKPAASGKK